jgi:hypothetical protein
MRVGKIARVRRPGDHLVVAENSKGTAKGRGRPFPKGMSGNPGGRPKVVAEIRQVFRAHPDTAVATLVDVMTHGRSDSARVAAATALLDRGWGKPTQTVETQGNGAMFPPGFWTALITGDPSHLRLSRDQPL